MSSDGGLHISKLIPNSITILSLCFGMLSLKLSMGGRWGAAMACILVAGVLDMLDGAAARMLRANSVFGAQLDSLCDILNFGLCPALALYMWGLRSIKFSGWFLVTLYVVCMALRLARFNAAWIQGHNMVLSVKTKMMKSMFFTGVPAPAGAVLLMLPIMLSMSLPDFCDQRLHPMQLQAYALMVALLLISPIPTFSLKMLRVEKRILPIMTMAFALFVMCLVTKPWLTVPIVCIAYILSIPCSALLYLRIKD